MFTPGFPRVKEKNLKADRALGERPGTVKDDILTEVGRIVRTLKHDAVRVCPAARQGEEFRVSVNAGMQRQSLAEDGGACSAVR